MAEPIFDLSTIVPDRKQIRVDGHAYDLARSDDFGLEERRELNRAWVRVVEIERKDSFVKTDDTEHDDLIKKLAGMLLPSCPKTLINKLAKEQRSALEAIVLAFFGSPSDPRMQAMMSLIREGNPTGVESSPASSDSTVETPPVG